MDNEKNKSIIDFWDKALSLSEEDKKELSGYSADDWKELAPSEKLYQAAASLGSCDKVLDYGCGNGWGGIVAARSGCKDVTAVDPAQGAADSARFYAEVFGAKDNMKIECIDTDWLKNVPADTYDGFICSNVIDVVMPDVAEAILSEAGRIVKKNGRAIIGMNYYISPEAAAAKGLDLKDGLFMYVDGILRLVSRSDEEWTKILGRYFTVERIEHFAWPGESEERRRLFYLKA